MKIETYLALQSSECLARVVEGLDRDGMGARLVVFVAFLEFFERVVCGRFLLLLGHGVPLVGDLASDFPIGDSRALRTVGYIC